MARSLNKVMLIGYIADEPVIRSTNNGGKVANVTLVTNERVKNQATNDWGDVPEWHRVVFWNRNADTVESFIHKGSRLYVEGHLKTNSYVDKTGVKRYSTEIVGDNLIMLDSRRDSTGGGDLYAANQFANGGGEYLGNNNNNMRFNGANNRSYNSYSDGVNRVNHYQAQGYAGNDSPYQNPESFAPAAPKPFVSNTPADNFAPAAPNSFVSNTPADNFAPAASNPFLSNTPAAPNDNFAPAASNPFLSNTPAAPNDNFAPAASSPFLSSTPAMPNDNFVPAAPNSFGGDNFAPASSGATTPQFPQAPASPSPMVESGGGDDDIPF